MPEDRSAYELLSSRSYGEDLLTVMTSIRERCGDPAGRIDELHRRLEEAMKAVRTSPCGNSMRFITKDWTLIRVLTIDGGRHQLKYSVCERRRTVILVSLSLIG